MTIKGVVTLSGSTRFKKQFEAVNLILSSKGYLVLLPASYGRTIENHDVQKWINSHLQELEELHRDKILRSHVVFIIDVDGYMGDSTKAEMEYTLKNFKKINLLSRELKEDKEPSPTDLFNDVDRLIYRKYVENE